MPRKTHYVSRHFLRSSLKANKASKREETRKVKYVYNLGKCAYAVYPKLSKSVHAWRNYSLPNFAFFETQCRKQTQSGDLRCGCGYTLHQPCRPRGGPDPNRPTRRAFLWKLSLTRTPDPIRPTRRGPDPNPTLEPCKISSSNFYGSSIWTKAWTSSKTAAFRCIVTRGRWFDASGVLVTREISMYCTPF